MTYPFSIKVNKCNGNYNNINNPYARVCIPSIIKNVTLKIFDLISLKNKTNNISELIFQRELILIKQINQ